MVRRSPTATGSASMSRHWRPTSDALASVDARRGVLEQHLSRSRAAQSRACLSGRHADRARARDRDRRLSPLRARTRAVGLGFGSSYRASPKRRESHSYARRLLVEAPPPSARTETAKTANPQRSCRSPGAPSTASTAPTHGCASVASTATPRPSQQPASSPASSGPPRSHNPRIEPSARPPAGRAAVAGTRD